LKLDEAFSQFEGRFPRIFDDFVSQSDDLLSSEMLLVGRFTVPDRADSGRVMKRHPPASKNLRDRYRPINVSACNCLGSAQCDEAIKLGLVAKN